MFNDIMRRVFVWLVRIMKRVMTSFYEKGFVLHRFPGIMFGEHGSSVTQYPNSLSPLAYLANANIFTERGVHLLVFTCLHS